MVCSIVCLYSDKQLSIIKMAFTKVLMRGRVANLANKSQD